jgi:hypothetical protein
MKTVFKERTNWALTLDWLWGIAVLAGTSYFVFIRHHSGWWFLLAIILRAAEFNSKKTEKDL